MAKTPTSFYVERCIAQHLPEEICEDLALLTPTYDAPMREWFRGPKKNADVVFVALVRTSKSLKYALGGFIVLRHRGDRSRLDVYVKPEFRGRGIGGTLVERARLERRRVIAHPWNERGRRFFSKQGFKVERGKKYTKAVANN